MNRTVALTDLDDAALAQRVQDAGGKPFQARQIAHWIYRHGVADYEAMKNVPAALKAALGAVMPVRSSVVETVDEAADGTEKLLVRLHDGHRQVGNPDVEVGLGRGVDDAQADTLAGLK